MPPRPNKAFAQAEANRVWSLFGLTSPEDFVIEDLAYAMGLFVVDGPLDSAAARLVRSGDKGLVRVSDRLQPGPRRFAIAHEIGHWRLHSTGTPLLACTDEAMIARYKTSPFETEASVFAGGLLMPSDIFKNRVERRRPTYGVLKELADTFRTSLTATALRYVETSNDYYVLVVSQDGFVKWWAASQSFGNHDLWIDHRTRVPQYSAAADIFSGAGTPSKPVKVDLGDWLGDMPHIDSRYVLEQAISIPAHNQVLSLIWLP